MHPITILIPAAALILGPRAWANYLLKKHNRKDLALSVTAGEFARDILDRRHLQIVRVESTDIVDHYDHIAKVVRISRNRIDRKTLTAITTAAHEVAHALQDASDYAPFMWRANLAKMAQVSGQVGSVLLLAVPLFSLTTRRPFPFYTMGSIIFLMLATGLIAQLAALPSELDASFNRALPMLRQEYIDEEQSKDARAILIACSTTYIAASMVSVLHFWPWFLTGAVAAPAASRLQADIRMDRVKKTALIDSINRRTLGHRPIEMRKPHKPNAMEPLIRQLVKPVVRSLMQLVRS